MNIAGRALPAALPRLAAARRAMPRYAMPRYQTAAVSQVALLACHRSLMQAVAAADLIVLRRDLEVIVGRERNQRGDWREHIVTVEIALSANSDKSTRIAISGASEQGGEAGREYVRHTVQSLLRRVEIDLRPRRLFV